LNDLEKNGVLLAAAGIRIYGPLSVKAKMERFKRIVLAVHNYADVNRVFPPSKEARNADGKSNLSWRVHLLPYLDQADLYSQFHINEPWDSPHNFKLLEKMPDIYKCYPFEMAAPNNLKPGYTTFLAPIGEDTIFGGTKPVKFSDVKDGTSNTVLFVEVNAERAVAWTAPDDYAFDMNNASAGLAIESGGRFLAAFADGSVRLLSSKLPSQTLVHLFQKGDGQVIDFQEK
jgi:hypothetical protein